MPVDRDQPLNAQRIDELGAGITIAPTARADEIATAIDRVLSDASYRDAARALGDASRDAGGADAAAAELEGLLA
jgi:UDP:flavonoid glycosyltransferase YjiC (YdhE family)